MTPSPRAACTPREGEWRERLRVIAGRPRAEETPPTLEVDRVTVLAPRD